MTILKINMVDEASLEFRLRNIDERWWYTIMNKT